MCYTYPMINPRSQISTELYIHAARAAVWQKFTQLHGWPTWQPTVSAVQWDEGDGWQEGAHFQVRTGSQQLRCVIRMVSPETATVWEVLNAAHNAVYSLHCTDQLGGCKVTIRATYHGVAVLLLWLQRGRRQNELQTLLAALKAYFERR